MAVNIQAWRYSGPLSSVTLRVGDENLDVVLHPGKVVRLPAEHEFTQTLAAQKRLVRVEEPQVAPKVPPPAGKPEVTGKSSREKGASQ